MWPRLVLPNPVPKKLFQERKCYFQQSKEKKKPWNKFEGMFPKLFMKYQPKREKKSQKDQIDFFDLEFLVKNGLF